MIKHIVCWKIKPDLDQEGVFEELKIRAEEMNGHIPGLMKVEVGKDFNRSEPAFDIALYAELESKEALNGYQEHPMHQLVREFITAVTNQRAVVDYEV